MGEEEGEEEGAGGGGQKTRDQPGEVTEALSIRWHHLSNGRNRRSHLRSPGGKPGHPSLLSIEYDARKGRGGLAAR